MQKKSITYVFGSGRIEKLKLDYDIAKEFFYGYQKLSLKNDCKIIEMSDPNEIIKPLNSFVDKILRKLTKFPIYTKDILSGNNWKILRKSEVIILTTDLLALSLVPYLIILSLVKKVEIYVIVMGLFGRKSNNFIVKIFQSIYLKILNSTVNKYLFLGKGEMDAASSNYSKFKNKFVFLPFSTDTVFWGKNDDNLENSSGILFIGNDGKRDYELVEQIAEKLQDIKFTFVTNQIKSTNCKNVNLINGTWANEKLTDQEIRDLYTKSRLTIIPLKESLQPSGQSVTLQSIATGTPVIITKTSGFWDETNFSNNENIFFNYENTLNSWCDQINKIYYDTNTLKEVSKNGLHTVNNLYNLEIFSSELKNIIKI